VVAQQASCPPTLASQIGVVEEVFGMVFGIAIAAIGSERTLKTLLKRILIDFEESPLM
jgi:hypothetical protein